MRVGLARRERVSDDFGEIIEYKLHLVDKSLFIKDIIDDIQTKVSVITRPRRFGKTLNLDIMLIPKDTQKMGVLIEEKVSSCISLDN